MPTYLYRGQGRIGTSTGPDAESVLDALADRLLDNPDVGGALGTLQRTGFTLRDGSQQPGTMQLAQSARRGQRSLTRTYAFDAVTSSFSHQLHDAIRDELQAIEEHFGARAAERNAAIDEWKEELEALAEHAAGTQPEGTKRLRKYAAEDQYEQLYIKISEAIAEARADQAEERERLGQFETLPKQAVDAARALEDYEFLSDDARESVAALNAERRRMAELAESEWRHSFTGDVVPDLDTAQEVAADLRELNKLEGHLRGGRLDRIDPQMLRDRLGVPALHAVQGLQQLAPLLREAGYLVEGEGGIRLSPRAMRRLGYKALSEMFAELKRGGFGEHSIGQVGPGVLRGANTRPFEAGDPFEIDLQDTLLRSAIREMRVPLRLHPTDFMVQQTDMSVHTATVLLLDLSFTMLRDGRITAAKKVALALDALIRTRFPKDTLELVGFSTLARSLSIEELPNVTPAPGQPFTNMQDALRMANRLLRRHRGANRQIIMISDGQPTAVTRDDGTVRSCFPPDEGIFNATIEAVQACTAHGITINIIMLDHTEELVNFVRRMAHVNRGRAFFCTPETVGQYVVYDYLRGKRLAVAGR